MTKRARLLAVAMATSSLLVAVPGAQAELRISKNFPMNNDTRAFRGKDAVGLGVNPANPNHIVAVNNEYLVPNCEGSASFNGGATWSNADELSLPPQPAGTQQYARACNAVGDHAGESQYQTVAFGNGQNVYTAYVTRPLNATGVPESDRSVVMLAKSTDGGRNWNTAVQVTPLIPGVTNAPFYTLPTVAVRPGATPGTDRVGGSAREETSAREPGTDARVAVSTNSGATFSAPRTVEPAGEGVADVSQPAFAPDGKLYIAWRTSGTPTTPGQTTPSTANVRIRRSDDGGDTWTNPAVTVAGVSNVASNSNTNPPAPLTSTASTFPRIAVGPNGNVYMVYNQGAAPPTAPPGGFTGADHFIPPDSDVYFQRSTNLGQNWSTPKLINDATPRPGNESPYNPAELGRVTQTRHPNIAVAPNGRVDIVWQDRRHWYRGCVHTHQFCEEARLGDTYLAQSSDNGATFGKDRRVTDRSLNNDVGYDYRFGVHWAFGPVVQPMGNNQAIIGWMDTRNGSFDNDRQDIYLARLNMNGPAAVPQESLHRSDPVATSVRLSQHTYPGGGEGLLNSSFASRNGTRVVIAPQGDAPAILAASVLARANLSQVLVSPPGGLPASVRAEVARMKPAGAYVVGSTGALGDQVISDLTAAGVPNNAGQIERLNGSGAELARQIMAELDRRTAAQQTANTPAFNAVALVNPNSPDAYAVAGLAAARRLPILFTENGQNPAANNTALGNADVGEVLVIGGPDDVSEAARNSLPAGTASRRLGGADQYATSQAVVAESVQRGLPTNLMYVADGTRPIDAALLGSTVGRVTALMALSRPPLSSTAAGTAAAAGLQPHLDRLILLQPVAAGGTPPVTPPRVGFPTATFPGCPTLTANVIRGTAAANTINGTTAADRIFAGTGNAVVDALAGNDCVDLGEGDDRGQGGLGNDLIVSGIGRDRVSGSAGNDVMRGNSGNDRLDGGRGNDRLAGDSGNDTLLGSFGNDRLHGVRGKDRISGSRGRDRINGGSSGDRISGGSSGDRISGDQGSDRINGNSGNDRIKGNSGNDRITSLDNSRDRVNCGTGRDSVLADRRDIVSRNCERVRRR